MSIRATKYEIEDLGSFFKGSSKKFKWGFHLEGKAHSLELDYSLLSGKRKLTLDDKTLHESMLLTSTFQYPFTLEGFAMNVIQQGNQFELRINNKVFSHLYTQQRTLNEFVFDGDEQKSQEQEQPHWSAKQSQPSEFNDFAVFSSQQNSKFSLNLRLDKKEEKPSFTYHKSASLPAQQGSQFGSQKLEAFESFGQFSTNLNQSQQNDPFSKFGFNDFNQKAEQNDVIKKQNMEMDLLDMDDPIPQKQEIQQDNAEISKDQLKNINVFDNFGQVYQGFDVSSSQAQVVQNEQQSINSTSQSSHLFDVFNLSPMTQQPIQTQPSQKNIFDLYGNQQQVGFNNISQNGLSQSQAIYQQQQLQNQSQFGYIPPHMQQQQQMTQIPMFQQQQITQGFALPNYPLVQQQAVVPIQSQSSTPFDLFR